MIYPLLSRIRGGQFHKAEGGRGGWTCHRIILCSNYADCDTVSGAVPTPGDRVAAAAQDSWRGLGEASQVVDWSVIASALGIEPGKVESPTASD